MDTHTVPHELHSIAVASSELIPASIIFVQKREAFLDALQGPAMERMKALHQAVLDYGGGRRISTWHDNLDKDTQRGSDAGALMRLLRVLERLAERGVKPFCNQVVRYQEPQSPAPDWSDFPEAARFLIPAAEKFGVIQFDSQVDHFLDSCTPEQYAELKTVAERIDAEDVRSLTHAWFKAHPMTQHTSAARYYFLIGLLIAMKLLD